MVPKRFLLKEKVLSLKFQINSLLKILSRLAMRAAPNQWDELWMRIISSDARCPMGHVLRLFCPDGEEWDDCGDSKFSKEN